jgi:NAD(P)-dependent dehydrogenase (short-subunit alcohol dehydrogenase family)
VLGQFHALRPLRDGLQRGQGRPGQLLQGAAAATVTGRFSTPEEVAALVVVLASDVAANVTGSDIRIDGGLIPTW